MKYMDEDLEFQFTIRANGLALVVYPYREWDTENNCQTRKKLFKNSWATFQRKRMWEGVSPEWKITYRISWANSERFEHLLTEQRERKAEQGTKHLSKCLDRQKTEIKSPELYTHARSRNGAGSKTECIDEV